MNRHVIGRMVAAGAIAVSGAAVAPAPASAAVGLQVWFDANKSGQYRNLQGGISNFSASGFNDVVSSAVANGSAWCLFEHKDYGGRQLRIAKGQYIANLTSYGFNDIASSAKRC